MSAADRDAGFTLVEVLVALAVFSLAALALLRLQGVTIATTARLDARLLAGIVAQNQIAEALVLRPAAGAGTETAGGRRWRWQRQLLATADPRVIEIRVTVSDAAGARQAVASVLRPAP